MIIGHISQNLDEIIFSENLKLAFDFLKSFKAPELRVDKIINIKGDEVYAMYS